ALLLRIVRRTGVDPEAVALGTLGVGALHLRVVHARAGDRALGVIDDEPRGHGAEPLEGAAVATEPGPHALVPDELHVLVTRETQRHHERPGAADLARGRIDQVGTGAKVHLCGLARREGEAHRGLGRLLAADLGDQPAHAGVVPAEPVLALERGVDHHAR